MSILWSIADAVNSGSCPILFKVQTLNVAMCIVPLYLSNFSFSLSSVADFSNTVASAPISEGHVVWDKIKSKTYLKSWVKRQKN